VWVIWRLQKGFVHEWLVVVKLISSKNEIQVAKCGKLQAKVVRDWVQVQCVIWVGHYLILISWRFSWFNLERLVKGVVWVWVVVIAHSNFRLAIRPFLYNVKRVIMYKKAKKARLHVNKWLLKGWCMIGTLSRALAMDWFELLISWLSVTRTLKSKSCALMFETEIAFVKLKRFSALVRWVAT